MSDTPMEDDEAWLTEVAALEKMSDAPLRAALVRAIVQGDPAAHRTLLSFVQACGIEVQSDRALDEEVEERARARLIRYRHASRWRLTELLLCLVVLAPDDDCSPGDETAAQCPADPLAGPPPVLAPTTSDTAITFSQSPQPPLPDPAATDAIGSYVSLAERRACSAEMVRLLRRLPTKAAFQGLYPLLIPTSEAMNQLRWVPDLVRATAERRADDFSSTGFGVDGPLKTKRVLIRSLLSSLMVCRPDGLRSLVALLLLDDRVPSSAVVDAASHLALLFTAAPSLLFPLEPDGTSTGTEALSPTPWAPSGSRSITTAEYFGSVGPQFVELMRTAGDDPTSVEMGTPNGYPEHRDTLGTRLRLFCGLTMHQLLQPLTAAPPSAASPISRAKLACANRTILGPAFAVLKQMRPASFEELQRAVHCVWCLIDAATFSPSNAAFHVVWETVVGSIIGLCAVLSAPTAAKDCPVSAGTASLCRWGSSCVHRVLATLVHSSILGPAARILFPLLRAVLTDSSKCRLRLVPVEVPDGVCTLEVCCAAADSLPDGGIQIDGEDARRNALLRELRGLRQVHGVPAARVISSLTRLLLRMLDSTTLSSATFGDPSVAASHRMPFVALLAEMLSEFGPEWCFADEAATITAPNAPLLDVVGALSATPVFLALSLPMCVLGCQLLVALSQDCTALCAVAEREEQAVLAALSASARWLERTENVETLLSTSSSSPAVNNLVDGNVGATVASVVAAAIHACHTIQQAVLNVHASPAPRGSESEAATEGAQSSSGRIQHAEAVLEAHLAPRHADISHALRSKLIGAIAVAVADLAAFVDEAVAVTSFRATSRQRTGPLSTPKAWRGCLHQLSPSSKIHAQFKWIAATLIECLAAHDDPFIVMQARHVLTWIALNRLDGPECGFTSAVLFAGLELADSAAPAVLHLPLAEPPATIRVPNVPLFQCKLLEVVVHIADWDADGRTLVHLCHGGVALSDLLMRIALDCSKSVLVRVAAVHSLGPVIGKQPLYSGGSLVERLVDFVSGIFRRVSPGKCRAAAASMISHAVATLVDLSLTPPDVTRRLVQLAGHLSSYQSDPSGPSNDDAIVRMHGEGMLRILREQQKAAVEELTGAPADATVHPLQQILRHAL